MTKVRNDQLAVTRIAIADCLDCGWTHQYSGRVESRRGKYTLLTGRAHALKNGHRVHVHRTTEFAPKKRGGR